MSPEPPAFVRHLREEGYHPRSDKHSNALAAAIVTDLLIPPGSWQRHGLG
jgi:hypothetical protein